MAKSEQFEATVYGVTREDAFDEFKIMAQDYFQVPLEKLWIRAFTAVPRAREANPDGSTLYRGYDVDFGAMLRPPVKGSPGFY